MDPVQVEESKVNLLSVGAPEFGAITKCPEDDDDNYRWQQLSCVHYGKALC